MNLPPDTNAARLAGQTLLWFAITAGISVAIGIGLGLVVDPGLHTSVSGDLAAEPSSTGSWLDFLTGLVPTNVFGLDASTFEADGGSSRRRCRSTSSSSSSSASRSASRFSRSARRRCRS